MKLGVIADIHGNALALEAVLTAARDANVTQWICCGDLIGYYYQPERVLSLLGELNFTAVRGNHEDLLNNALNDPASASHIRGQYGSGIKFARENLSDIQIDFLHNLPKQQYLTFGAAKLLLCHGSPWDTNYYIYPDATEDCFSRCAETGVDYLVLGHTHYPMAKRFGKTMIFNPGSVGQPRNGNAGAAWAFLDTETGKFEHRIETYDISYIEEQARTIDNHLPYLWEVFHR
jgi:putative phosphoesterase